MCICCYGVSLVSAVCVFICHLICICILWRFHSIVSLYVMSLSVFCVFHVLLFVLVFCFFVSLSIDRSTIYQALYSCTYLFIDQWISIFECCFSVCLLFLFWFCLALYICMYVCVCVCACPFIFILVSVSQSVHELVCLCPSFCFAYVSMCNSVKWSLEVCLF